MMDHDAASKAPNTTSQYFAPEGCTMLMMICGVMNEGDLPDIWHLLPQYGKKERLTVELELKQMAQCSGFIHSAPIVTPEFTKRHLSLNFA
jgi:hypothetical protein